MRVFLDSNVIFSGLYSSGGAPAEILQLSVRGEFRIVISRLVLDEIISVVQRKAPGALPALRELLVNAELDIYDDPTLQEVQPWLDLLQVGDAAVLAAAINSEVDYLVSGDRHFLSNKDIAIRSRLKILSPADFLAAWPHSNG
jgi:putative PIN family toxin of toxin-antitoxin system